MMAALKECQKVAMMDCKLVAWMAASSGCKLAALKVQALVVTKVALKVELLAELMDLKLGNNSAGKSEYQSVAV